MRVSDYISKFLMDQGIKDSFLITGAGMMFLSDGIYLNKQMRYICTHHEQAVAMAAVGYAKFKNDLAVAYVSTGCGGTNAVTGLLHAHQDSVPVIFISGQVKMAHTTRLSGLKLRGFGIQEVDIIPIVESLSKYSVMLTNPNEVAYHLEKAVFFAKSGRPGPVWIDVPMDIQSASINEEDLIHFDPLECRGEVEIVANTEDIHEVLNGLKSAKRPVIICGQGVRLSRSTEKFRYFIEKHKIPVVAPFLGIGILPTDHNQFIGRIGSKGDRPGNFTIQNADFVLVLGSSLCPSAIGYDGKVFARGAKMVVVDIDKVEHQKEVTRIDMFIHSELKYFLEKLSEINEDFQVPIEWQKICKNWKEKYPTFLKEYAFSKGGVNLYHFVDVLGKLMRKGSVVVSDAGSAFYVPTQAMPIFEGNRYITSGGQAEMGFTIPGAIGACIANDNKEVIGITGDGSFQFNIQELQTIVQYNLPIKLFVWNNNGYLSIRASQDRFFEGRYIGTDASNGVSFPSLEKIAYAYGIPYLKIETSQEVDMGIRKVLDHSGPMICEVMCLEKQEIIPSTSTFKKSDGTLASRPLEDMYPFLDRDEFFKNMIIPPIDE